MPMPNQPPPLPQDLSRSHPKFPSMSLFELYDHVTRMYLDCWNDADIANALSEQLSRPVDAHVVNGLRTEAAMAAEHQPIDIRRRWIYRYPNITVNNLVKEYMFMEGKAHFLTAKRELAEEIESLVAETPHKRLCIAVNDALGRNNIGIEHIRELQDYAGRIRALEQVVQEYERTRGTPPGQGLAALAKEVALICRERCKNDPAKTAKLLVGILGLGQTAYEARDVELLVEYDRFAGDDGNYSLMVKLLKGADIPPRLSSALDIVAAGTAKHLSIKSIESLIKTIQSRSIQSFEVLENVRHYAHRHIKDLATLRELGIPRPADADPEATEITTLRMLLKLVDQHLTLLDATRFLENSEVRKAAKRNISQVDLQTLLARFNSMEFEADIRKLAQDVQLNRQFEFPIERYLTTRFSLRL